MFMRVVRSSIDPAKIDEALLLADEMIAAMKRQPGFVTTQGGVSRATGAPTTISTWESEDTAERGRSEHRRT
jgi:quinol monooxygenase YgiN